MSAAAPDAVSPTRGGPRTAVFAGSFDPVTLGHLDLMHRALAVADRLVVAVAVNSTKQPLLTLDERTALVRESLGAVARGPGARAEVRPLEGLLVRFARDVGATLLVRGLRGAGDFDYEVQMALMNRHVAPEVDTIFLAPSPATAFVSSTLVREVSRLGGDVSALVPPVVAEALARRFAR